MKAFRTLSSRGKQPAAASVGVFPLGLGFRTRCRLLAGSSRLLRFMVWMACGTALTATARDERRARHPEAGWSGQIELDYDQSRARTSVMRAGFEVEWGSPQRWVSLSGDFFGELDPKVNLPEDGYVALELGQALYRNNDQRKYVNAILSIEPHSLLASQGWDLAPSLGAAWGLTSQWWVGGEVGGVLATAPDQGNRSGYPQLSLWVTWLCHDPSQKDDALSLGLWVAGNEIPQDDSCLFMELEYSFAVGGTIEAKLALGTDPVSPWEPLGVYLRAGLSWHF